MSFQKQGMSSFKNLEATCDICGDKMYSDQLVVSLTSNGKPTEFEFADKHVCERCAGIISVQHFTLALNT